MVVLTPGKAFMDNISSEYLTPEQVAEKLQISKYTVGDWLRSGKLPGFKIGNLWRVEREDLEEFIEQHRSSETNLKTA